MRPERHPEVGSGSPASSSHWSLGVSEGQVGAGMLTTPEAKGIPVPESETWVGPEDLLTCINPEYGPQVTSDPE